MADLGNTRNDSNASKGKAQASGLIQSKDKLQTLSHMRGRPRLPHPKLNAKAKAELPPKLLHPPKPPELAFDIIQIAVVIGI